MTDNDKYESLLPGNGGDAGGADVAAAPSADLQREIETLKKEREDLYDRVLRKQAEFENYKKRMDREKSDFMQFASAELMKEILNALDSFELNRAIYRLRQDDFVALRDELIERSTPDVDVETRQLQVCWERKPRTIKSCHITEPRREGIQSTHAKK